MPDRIVALPLLADNYAYLIVSGDRTAVVDPADAGPIIEWLERNDRSLDIILNTHHHGDHCDGNETLKKKYGARILGPDDRRIPGLDQGVPDGGTFSIGNLTISASAVPGHTRSHMAFYSPASKAVFTGDTLFSCGCGRLFEGNAEQMWQSLLKLRALPDDTMIYPGHEYTEDNIRFALSVDPENSHLKTRQREVIEAREKNQPSIPVSLATEKRTNPFLRADDPAIASSIGMSGKPAAVVFARLREMKNQF